ncbi:hypothetical protein ACFQVC_04415 [Streptomyces monticola]|uniref:Uncharacterized protein n=1 Tax=Streptomyces monticola TaxID=2666263 RepID=A0ABW2JCV3_9ACTN
MRADIAWWDLDGTGHTVDSLYVRLREDDWVRPWNEVPGLALKFWIADRAGNRWGAVMLWDPERPEPGLLPPNRAAELLGGPPSHRESFEVQAAAGATAFETGPEPGSASVQGSYPHA